MIIAIASGKGGTGKTTVAVSLALALSRGRRGPVRLVDADVEEPNAHLFLHPRIAGSREVAIPVPVVDESRCDFCGRCAEVCAYHALAVLKDAVLVFAELCHGCGGCARFCPRGAIREEDRRIGVVEWGRAGALEFAHGRLDVGQPMSPPLIRDLKTLIDRGVDTIVDAPPGTSCPVVTAVKGSDACLLVTEPTPFGLHDLRLAADTVAQLDVPAAVLVNRWTPGEDDGGVEAFCAERRLPIVMRIPLDRAIAAAYAEGVPLLEAFPEYGQAFREAAARLEEMTRR